MDGVFKTYTSLHRNLTQADLDFLIFVQWNKTDPDCCNLSIKRFEINICSNIIIIYGKTTHRWLPVPHVYRSYSQSCWLAALLSVRPRDLRCPQYTSGAVSRRARCSLTYTAWKNRYRFYFSLPGSGCYFRFSILWPFLRSQPHLFQWRWQAWWIKYFPPRRQSLRCVRPVLNTQGYQRRLRHRHLSFSLRVFRRSLSRKAPHRAVLRHKGQGSVRPDIHLNCQLM